VAFTRYLANMLDVRHWLGRILLQLLRCLTSNNSVHCSASVPVAPKNVFPHSVFHKKYPMYSHKFLYKLLSLLNLMLQVNATPQCSSEIPDTGQICFVELSSAHFFDNQRTHKSFINWILKLVVGCSNLPEGTKLHKDTRLVIPARQNVCLWKHSAHSSQLHTRLP